mmetsp:Transcript_71813/g.219863  ORF Transcript_71813/g.219863 Transcript_71813/m.219863 type:complete len:339 (+) Transcript_71813:2625-3641(+)
MRCEFLEVVTLEDVNDADVIQHAPCGLALHQRALELRLVAAEHGKRRSHTLRRLDLVRRSLVCFEVADAEEDGIVHDVALPKEFCVLPQGGQELGPLGCLRYANDLVGEIQVFEHHPWPRVDPSVFRRALEVVHDVGLEIRRSRQDVVHYHELNPQLLEADLEGTEKAREHRRLVRREMLCERAEGLQENIELHFVDRLQDHHPVAAEPENAAALAARLRRAAFEINVTKAGPERILFQAQNRPEVREAVRRVSHALALPAGRRRHGDRRAGGDARGPDPVAEGLEAEPDAPAQIGGLVGLGRFGSLAVDPGRRCRLDVRHALLSHDATHLTAKPQRL